MLTCTGCHSQQYNGTIFCPLCGKSLLLDDQQPVSTASLRRKKASGSRLLPSGSGQLPGAHGPLVVGAVAAPAPTAVTGRELRATLLNNGRQIKLSLQRPILVGRSDSNHTFTPDLDLSKDGGFDGGVSRRHARITPKDAEIFIEDLDSSNGTFVNNQRVAAKTCQPLRVGDELRLGSMLIRIEAI